MANLSQFWRTLLFLLICVSAGLAETASSATTETSASTPPRTVAPAELIRQSRSCGDQLCRYRALDKALALDPTGLEANLAFAEYYMDRGQTTRAGELLDFVLKVYPQNFSAHSIEARLAFRLGDRTKATRLLREMEQETAGDSARQKQLTLDYERAGMIADAIRVGQPLLRANPSDSEMRAAFIRLAQKKHDARLLRWVADTVLATDPKNPEATISLARLNFAEGRCEQAVADMQQAVSDHPGNSQLQRVLTELIQRSHPADHSRALIDNNADPDAPWMADANALAKTSLNGFGASSNSVLLADVRIDRVHPSGVYSSHIQQVIRLNTPDAGREYSVRNVQYSSRLQMLTIEKARLFKRDGRVMDAIDDGEESVGAPASSVFYDARRHIVRFPEAQAGDTIELNYRLDPVSEENPYGHYFASLYLFRDSIPVQQKRLVVFSTPELPLTIAEHEMNAGKRVAAGAAPAWMWEASALQPISAEPSSPGTLERSPYVHLSSLSDWQQLGRWYTQLVAPQMQLSDELRELAAQITDEHPDPKERMRSIYELVTRRTRYVGLEFGVYSYKPYPVSRVYERRFGDCKDKASLIVALLRATGIPAEFAMVRTRGMGQIDKRAVSVSLFDHAVAYVPQFDLFLDGTMDYGEPGELPESDQGARVVTVSADGVATERQIPILGNNAQIRDLTAELTPTGSLQLQGRLQVEGAGAAQFRREGQSNDRRVSDLDRSLADAFRSLKFDQVLPKPDVNAVEFTAQAAPRGSGREVVLRSSWAEAGFQQQFASQGSRRDVLLIQPVSRIHETMQVKLPAGARLAELPKGIDLKTEFGSAQIRFSVENGEVLIASDVTISTVRIDPRDYAGFREFCGTIDQALRREVKVTLP